MLVNQSLGHNELRTFAGLGGQVSECETADGKRGRQMCYGDMKVFDPVTGEDLTKTGCSPCEPYTESTSKGGGFTSNLSLPAWWRVASVAGTGIGAYHGWKRNKKAGWAIAWALMGGLAPVIVIPLAFAQGFGKRRS